MTATFLSKMLEVGRGRSRGEGKREAKICIPKESSKLLALPALKWI